MNTETFINGSDKEVQPVKSIDLNARPATVKEAEKSCRNGVCEVAWKPFAQTPGEVKKSGT